MKEGIEPGWEDSYQKRERLTEEIVKIIRDSKHFHALYEKDQDAALRIDEKIGSTSDELVMLYEHEEYMVREIDRLENEIEKKEGADKEEILRQLIEKYEDYKKLLDEIEKTEKRTRKIERNSKALWGDAAGSEAIFDMKHERLLKIYHELVALDGENKEE